MFKQFDNFLLIRYLIFLRVIHAQHGINLGMNNSLTTVIKF
jgi:hypothetical protein